MSVFDLTECSNGWMVQWKNFKNVTNVDTKQRLLDIVFRDLKCWEVGFGVKAANGEIYTLWIDSTLYWQDTRFKFGWEEQHEICGCLFRTREPAEQFLETLEERYTWHILKSEIV